MICSEFVATGGAVPPANVAVTDTAVVPSVKEQTAAAVLVHPDHDTVPPEAVGVAVSVIVEPGVSPPLHVCGPGPQVMPPPDTVPRPFTVRESGTSWANVAVTVRSLSIWTVHVDCEPVQSPLGPQPTKAYPLCGVAVSVTLEFGGSCASQVEPGPQLMPPPVTEPLPLTDTVSGFVLVEMKVALAVLFVVRYVAHADEVAEHEPPQPPKK